MAPLLQGLHLLLGYRNYYAIHGSPYTSTHVLVENTLVQHKMANRPIACDVTFGHFCIRPFGRRHVGGQKGIAVMERKALIISLFTNASNYSNKTCMERFMCLHLTNIVVSLE